MSGAKILAFGSYCPDNVVTNDDLSEIVDTTHEWIKKRTGISERRISTGEGTAELAAKAAERAMEACNCKPEEIDLILVATTSPDSLTPSTACVVQHLLGCENARAFDIGAACSGFVYGLVTANSFIKSGESKKALVIGSEVLSKLINWEDRNTCVLFGDGAGAAVLEFSNDHNGVIATHLGSNGTLGLKSLTTGTFPVRNPFCKEEEKKIEFMEMDGREIFRFAATIIPKVVHELLEKSGEKLDDIKYVVTHQANIRIIEEASKRLDCSMEKFFVNLDRTGNTSAASVPIALAEMQGKNLLNKGDKVILVGFGGGLTWGGALIEL